MKGYSTTLLPVGIVFVALGLIGMATGNPGLLAFLAVGGAFIGAAVRRRTRGRRDASGDRI